MVDGLAAPPADVRARAGSRRRRSPRDGRSRRSSRTAGRASARRPRSGRRPRRCGRAGSRGCGSGRAARCRGTRGRGRPRGPSSRGSRRPTIRQNRQSGSAAHQQASAAMGGRRDDGDEPADDPIGARPGRPTRPRTRPMTFSRRPRPEPPSTGDERVVRRVADPATVVERATRTGRCASPPTSAARPARPGVGGEREELGRAALLRSARRPGRSSGSPPCRVARE